MINLLISFIEEEQPVSIINGIQSLGLSLKIHPGTRYVRSNLSPDKAADELFNYGAQPNIFLAVISSARNEGTPVDIQRTFIKYWNTHF